FERSEFASSPSLRHKFKESFAISGAHFFAYFLWARPKKVSQPRQGMKQGMHRQPKNQRQKTPTPFDAPFFSWITVSPPPPTTQRATP
ncbi:hypothetical protein, partial [Ralstonia pickettii]|uniref:hypothetical protein n=2 Tax=Ralstonia TaxID=48736 RepID=UPI0029CA51BD